MQITILGCGSSGGVPVIGCGCYVCKSPNSRNFRTRPSIHIATEKAKILVDTSVDLRMQALKNNIFELDAVFYTHDHADHSAGIDDIRYFAKHKKALDAYMDERTYDRLSARYPYIFSSNQHYSKALERKILPKEFSIGDVKIHSFDQVHGEIMSKGFRFNDIVYSTDFNDIPEDAFQFLEGLELWIVDCLSYTEPRSHSYLDKTLSLIERVKPRKAALTHMGHDIDYDEIMRMLPSNVEPAYDGMVIKI